MPQSLAGFCDEIGEKPFRASSCCAGYTGSGEADFAAMSDLAKGLREKLSTAAVIAALRVSSAIILPPMARASGCLSVGAGNGIETVFIPETNRGTLVYLQPGRLCAGMYFLLYRQAGIQP